MHISKAFAMMAAILPTSVLFHIHQVVAAFHINKVIKAWKKKWFLFCNASATINNGINAKKISTVSKDGNIAGHAAANNKPDIILNVMDNVLFTNSYLDAKVRKNYWTIRTIKMRNIICYNNFLNEENISSQSNNEIFFVKSLHLYQVTQGQYLFNS